MKLKVQVDNPNILFEFVSVGSATPSFLKKTLEKKSPEWKFKTVQLNDPWARRELKFSCRKLKIPKQIVLKNSKIIYSQEAGRTHQKLNRRPR